MQKPHIELMEIIWEVTGRCNNKCNYCGSKSVNENEIAEGKISKILDKICKFPPKNIDISGGDPLLLSYELHKEIVSKLKALGTCVKIVVNPKSFNNEETILIADQYFIKYKSILSLYDFVGISVSTHTEIAKAKEFFIENPELEQKCTIITNFNVNNVFLFNKIKWLVESFKRMWQIQYTMFHNPDDPQALYNNDAALYEFFADHLAEAIAQGLPLVLADNMNCGRCTAGMYSIGILDDGVVVPCLSMRSWIENMTSISQGNVLNNDLEHIWSHYFTEYRNSEFFCCKDSCKGKQIDMMSPEFVAKVNGYKTKNIPLKPYFDEKERVLPVFPHPNMEPQIIMYAVFPADPNFCTNSPKQPHNKNLILMYGVKNFTKN
jgi:MoaA/NifB/PqqE/SkfB family radical SAM enzyme